MKKNIDSDYFNYLVLGLRTEKRLKRNKFWRDVFMLGLAILLGMIVAILIWNSLYEII